MSDPETQLLTAISAASVEAIKPILEPILVEEARKILAEELLSGAEAQRRFGVKKEDLPYIPPFQPSVHRNKQYQVKDVVAYINNHKKNATKKKL